jgi:hypothetical protein
MADNPPALTVGRYAPGRKSAWDAFVSTGKNATFLFLRDYMDYHSDRFKDHSLMISRGDELVAIMPANQTADNMLISHQGLTYGGLVVPRAATVADVLECFHTTLRSLQALRIDRLLYKRIPTFYNTLPDDDVAYAMFLLEAQLYRRDIAIVVAQANRLPFQERRRRQIKKAIRANLRVTQDTSFRPYWERVLVPRLAQRYGIRPAHTVEEITLLASRFPENIKQFSVYSGDDILAGTTIYETPTVAHAKYIAVTDTGRRLGALDLLVGWLVEEGYKAKAFFDFGICNENEGRTLNPGLLDWKEGFGGRAYAHDFYHILTQNYAKLEPVLNHCRAWPKKSSLGTRTSAREVVRQGDGGG